MKNIFTLLALLITFIASSQVVIVNGGSAIGDTDSQQLSLQGTLLQLENSASVNLDVLGDNLEAITQAQFDALTAPQQAAYTGIIVDSDVNPNIYATLAGTNVFTAQQQINSNLIVTGLITGVSSLSLNGSTSGATTVQAPAVAGTSTITLPTTNLDMDDLLTVHPESDEPTVRVGVFDDQASVDAATIAAGDIAFCATCRNYDYPQIFITNPTSDLTTGDDKGYWIAPAAGTIETPANDGVSIYLHTAGTTTGVSLEIDKNGTDITTTAITTDATENDSDNATTDFALTTYTFVRGDKFEFNLDAVPTGAKWALVTLKVYYD